MFSFRRFLRDKGTPAHWIATPVPSRSRRQPHQDMVADRREQLKSLLERALMLSHEERERFLGDVYGEEAALGAELSALLANIEEAEDFFDGLAGALLSTVAWAQDRAGEARRLFVAVLELGPEEREGYLNQACAHDPEMREEVLSLLQAFEARARGLHPALDRLPSELDTLRNDQHLEGRTVSRYQIYDKLGGGGMGVVYKAYDERLDRVVALKFLPGPLSLDAAAKERFKQEARAASALDHTNICTIYDIDETTDGQLFIAMAYYDGETLKKKIRRAALSLDEALDYAMQLAGGLARAHEQGIIHRDIKPANVMVTREGIIKILDFGLAKMAGLHLTRDGATMGTVAYMSPEQARGEVVDHQSDIWSLGVVLYEMLTGAQPFQADYEQALLYMLLHSEPAPVAALNPAIPPVVAHLVGKCLQKDQKARYRSASALLLDLAQARRAAEGTGKAVVRTGDKDDVSPARLFISYKRSGEPDDRVARALYEALSEHHDVFIDKLMPVGTRWVQQIETEMAQADFLIVLLSAQSVQSEMILAEIEMAQRIAGTRDGRPVILPVRLNHQAPFTYPLSAYLNAVNWTYWEGEGDTPRLIDELSQAISRGRLATRSLIQPPRTAASSPREVAVPVLPVPLAAAQPRRLELPEGTMDPESDFYVQRPHDEVALRAIERQGVTITIKGPRQMGKSSLLIRTMAAAAEAGKEVVFLDFQLFDQAALGDSDTFFRQFCALITDELDLEDKVDEYWERPLGNSQRCTRYMERHLLKTLDRPVLLAMDEVERVFETDFRSDFFSMLRSWHNDRAIKPRWKQLDLALVTSTEPYQLIENLNQSPFNVGEVIEVSDFLPEQVADLDRRHGAPLGPGGVEQLMRLLAGHPYLVRKALYLVAGGRITMDELLTTATEERGPFGDHLRHHLFRLHGQPQLAEGLRQVLRHHACDDEAIFWRLRGAGLVRREGRAILPRCALYASYFQVHLHG